MSIPNTKDSTGTFIDDEPSWEMGMDLRMGWKTKVFTHRDETEQRANVQAYAKVGVNYVIGDLSTFQFGLRKARYFKDDGEKVGKVTAPLWPIWMPEADGITTDTISWNGITDDEALAWGFRVGGHAFLQEDGLTSVFREIDSIAESLGVLTITFVSGNAAYPDIAVPSFTASGVIVRPCVGGVRKDGAQRFIQNDLGHTDEMVSIEGL